MSFIDWVNKLAEGAAPSPGAMSGVAAGTLAGLFAGAAAVAAAGQTHAPVVEASFLPVDEPDAGAAERVQSGSSTTQPIDEEW